MNDSKTLQLLGAVTTALELLFFHRYYPHSIITFSIQMAEVESPYITRILTKYTPDTYSKVFTFDLDGMSMVKVHHPPLS